MTGIPTEMRLRWLCRRGMLELDAWLTRFLEERYPALPLEQQACFAQLLNQDDMTLYDWFTGEQRPAPEFQALVEEIKRTPR